LPTEFFLCSVKGGEQMLVKNYTKTKKKCRVTFKYPNQEHADSAMLAGEFNGWSTIDTPMKKLKDGTFSVTISLLSGYSYAFRYILDGNTWVNDPEADKYAANEHGESNSLLIL
jgi:1,4-alpha-glucan branching enzyme